MSVGILVNPSHTSRPPTLAIAFGASLIGAPLAVMAANAVWMSLRRSRESDRPPALRLGSPFSITRVGPHCRNASDGGAENRNVRPSTSR